MVLPLLIANAFCSFSRKNFLASRTTPQRAIIRSLRTHHADKDARLSMLFTCTASVLISPPTVSFSSSADLHPTSTNLDAPQHNTGEVINSMRLSEARLLLSRYNKNRRNGTPVPAAGALPAVGVKELSAAPAAAAAQEGGGVSADRGASTEGGAAGEGAAAAALAVERGLMRRVEKAVMALTEVHR